MDIGVARQDSVIEGEDDLVNNARHIRLRSRPIFWAAIGVVQTLLTAGVVFGWASLLPVLRIEQQQGTAAAVASDSTSTSAAAAAVTDESDIDIDYEFSPQAYAQVFTLGAVGNYISTLFFGFVLDYCGPRMTGIIASILFAVGLILCGQSTEITTTTATTAPLFSPMTSLAIGFGLLGFAGPGIQMPTLHLANLFGAEEDDDDDDLGGKKHIEGSGSSGGAIFMSSQAAAFDGGTAVFAILRYLFQTFELPSKTFFTAYLIIPVWVLLTSIFIWPDDILEKEDDIINEPPQPPPPSSENNNNNNNNIIKKSPHRRRHERKGSKDYIGIGSPYLSPARLSGGSSTFTRNQRQQQEPSLVNAPLSVILRKPAFYSLAIWTSIHILKLNFVVATINDQLVDDSSSSSSSNINDDDNDEKVERLMDIFGAMLPFGFVALPLVAKMLSKSAFYALQVANIVGVLYGAVLLLAPTNFWLLTFCVFPFVATSRQLVYSTVFSQIGEVFGFANYGMLLGLVNISVSGFSTIQNPLIGWSETVHTYYPANFILLLVTFPLFGIAYLADPNVKLLTTLFKRKGSRNDDYLLASGENMPLLKRGKMTDSERNDQQQQQQPGGTEGFRRPRGLSDGGMI